MRDVYYNSPDHSKHVWLISRQLGKSYLIAILALEQCLRSPNSVVKILTDTKIHVQSIFEPIFNEILVDCPEDLKPTYSKKDYKYIFSNKSQIQLAGSDQKHYQRLRGQRSNAIFIDEAGFCSNLSDAVRSVLIPTTTHTGGKIVMASTPPQEEIHDFYDFIEEAEVNNNLIKKTIYDNPMLTEDDIQRLAKEVGGTESNTFKREYLCYLIRSEDSLVFPEFNEELEKDIVKDVPVPSHYDSYVSMDLGGKDLTAVLFGYFDFRTCKVVFQDELVVDFSKPGETLPKLVLNVLNKEKELWLNPLTNEVKPPTLRVSDINILVTQEIGRASHGKLNFTPAKKDDKGSAINNLRALLANGQILINPRCKNLIAHLKNCRWSKSKDKMEFARNKLMGHFDCVDAAIYFVRHIAFNKNPFPMGYGLNLRPEDSFVKNSKFNSNQLVSEQVNVLSNLFSRRK